MTSLCLVPTTLALVLSTTAFAADAALLNPPSLHPDLEVVVLAEAATVDARALEQVRGTLFDPAFLLRDGGVGIIDPTTLPAGREMSVDAVADEWLSTDDLDPTGMLGMEGIPVMRTGTRYIGVSGILVGVPDDPIGANPTPYPYPVPTFAYPDIGGWYPNINGWLVGVEPSTLLVGDGRSWVAVQGVALVLDGDAVVGALGTPTFDVDGRAVRPEAPLLLVDWE